MTNEEGHREIIYQMTMDAARLLLKEHLITKDQYIQFDTIMQQKYMPIFGGLFTNLNLL